jgi:hypothetical protein
MPVYALTFLTTDYAKPFASAAAFGNKFAGWCKQAGLEKASSTTINDCATSAPMVCAGRLCPPRRSWLHRAEDHGCLRTPHTRAGANLHRRSQSKAHG